jgi:hypothetical protein
MISIASIVAYCKGNTAAFDTFKKTKLDQDHKMLGKKRKADPETRDEEEHFVLNENNEIEEIPRKNMIIKKSHVKKVHIETSDQDIITGIDAIVDSFYETIGEDAALSKEDILNCLRINSFNITNTYLYLSDPEQFTSK